MLFIDNGIRKLEFHVSCKGQTVLSLAIKPWNFSLTTLLLLLKVNSFPARGFPTGE